MRAVEYPSMNKVGVPLVQWSERCGPCGMEGYTGKTHFLEMPNILNSDTPGVEYEILYLYLSHLPAAVGSSADFSLHQANEMIINFVRPMSSV
jgi:hypothetical protein